ncbi:FadR/GntR family transcriptional regulator [Caulobacter sp. S45]|uniref:FadR/GntR family transcriptional regulator n=1 Tax=Caulobacter sp. S45 TaxID=1641861 RepID=UPI00131DDC18|nr:FadR/GntR family transcriptional regulator [Caulobacter sp. S45]
MRGRSDAPQGEKPAPAKERIHTAIARQLGVLIVSGAYKPGDLLDNEIASSEQLQVSRSAYREAMRILAAKGLVESRPKTGTRVSPQSHWRLLDPEVLAWLFESQPSLEFLKGLFELRMIVEPEAAALAASRRTSDDVSRMRRALQDMERNTVATDEGRAADREFHDAVLDATRNPVVISLASGIGAAVRWTTIYKQRDRSLPRDPMPEHWKVFDAIAMGSPDEARIAMQALVAQAQEDTRLSL